MSIFVCDICEHFENTAVAGPRGYHLRNMPLTDREKEDHPEWVEAGLGDGKARCSGCNPEIGHWHGHWPKEPYDELSAAHHRRAINR